MRSGVEKKSPQASFDAHLAEFIRVCGFRPGEQSGEALDHAGGDLVTAIAELESVDVARSIIATLPTEDHGALLAVLNENGEPAKLMSADIIAGVIARSFLEDFVANPADFRSRAGIAPVMKDEHFRALLPKLLPQQTSQEFKRVARGLALAPDGIGWSELVGELALVHLDNRAEHNLRLEGGLIPEWWGKPSDIASLRRELAENGGHDGIAVFHNALGLVLHSDNGHVDVNIDEMIGRAGIDPRSKAERTKARLKIWRILMILGAIRVVGARRSAVRDSVTGKNVQLESNDPLLTVSPFKRVGTQETFDAGTAPLKVTLQATPWLSRWRGNRAVLQDFGSLLAITEIPIGKPSGAWARAIGLALQQLWREQATHADYGRAGEDHRRTVQFESFTRRELLELFPPKPGVHDVLEGANPSRAIEYWDTAIAMLREPGSKHRIIGHYSGSRDWSKRPHKDWAGPRKAPAKGKADPNDWLDEPLDIRPLPDGAAALYEIYNAQRSKKRKVGRPRKALKA
jgi:hypothetical protein